MKYIKSFEGFSIDQINNFVVKGETSVIKIDRKINNKYNKLSDDIMKYDISNFSYIYENGQFKIYPDSNFLELYKRYCYENNFKYKKLIFTIEITHNYPFGGYNFLDVYDLIYNNLKGLSMGYKLYKYVLNIIDFIMTNKDILPEAKNLWYNLLQDTNLYSGTNKEYNIIINKNISDNRLKEIINKVSNLNLNYDDDLNKKIKNLYE